MNRRSLLRLLAFLPIAAVLPQTRTDQSQRLNTYRSLRSQLMTANEIREFESK